MTPISEVTRPESRMARAAVMPPHALLVGAIGFLTLVDLFATQAILPSLVQAYQATPAAMGFAVNASTIGMAAASFAISISSPRIDRRLGICASLMLLTVPTTLLASAPTLGIFTALRIAQGLCMASAFALTMTYLAELLPPENVAGTLASYVTGVVASNLLGRLIAAAVVDFSGLAANFYLFATLNIAGALLVLANFERMKILSTASVPARTHEWKTHLRSTPLRVAFAIGFLILFSFIGIFTYVNFVLAGPAFGMDRMKLGLIYFVFLPSMVTTPLAGRFALKLGSERTIRYGLGIALLGLPLLIVPNVIAIASGLALIGIGTFFAQAATTGFVGRAAKTGRASASGLYLTSYYLGGLAGASVLGPIFECAGWAGCVMTCALTLGAAFLASSSIYDREFTGAGSAA